MTLIYAFYLDVFFLHCLFMNASILILTFQLMKIPIRKNVFKISFGLLGGVAGSVMILLIAKSYRLYIAGTYVFAIPFMLWFSAKMRSLREYVRTVLVSYGVALLLGGICAFAAARWPLFRQLTAPLVQLIRAIPVAVFTIVVFLWVSRPYIPSTIVFLTVLPIVWSNVETGLRHADRQLSEMARVFGMGHWDVLRRVTLPGIRPYVTAAVTTGVGFAWKSGIAAEVICRTQGSLGDLLWSGKAGVSYDEVFALTVVIVVCSGFLQRAATGLRRKEERHDPS